MEGNKDKTYIVRAEGEVPFAQKTADGYELYNNERTMKFLVSKHQFNDTEREVFRTYFSSICFVKEREDWTKGDNYHQTDTITEFVKQLNVAPSFTKAVKEYRQQMQITEVWHRDNL